MRMSSNGKKASSTAFMRTLKDFCGNSTVHGVGYLLSPSSSLSDRILWLCIVILSLCLASHLSITAYTDWQQSLVITSLRDTTKPVSAIAFPAVTICTEGLDMEAVNDALAKDFMVWLNDTNLDQDLDENTLKENLKMFLKTNFEID